MGHGGVAGGVGHAGCTTCIFLKLLAFTTRLLEHLPQPRIFCLCLLSSFLSFRPQFSSTLYLLSTTLASSLPTLNLARYMGHTQHGGVGQCRIIESTAPRPDTPGSMTYICLVTPRSVSVLDRWQRQNTNLTAQTREESWNNSMTFYVDFHIIFYSKTFTTQTTPFRRRPNDF